MKPKKMFFTQTEVARIIGVTIGAVRHWIHRDGKLKARKIGGVPRVLRKDLEAFLGCEIEDVCHDNA